MYHLRRIKSLVLTLLVCMAAQAQIQNGKVYRIVNVGKSDKSMAIGNLNNVVASTTTDANDYAQLWYAESNSSGFALRNLANGRYLYSPNATSGAWLTSKEVNTDNSVFTATSVGGNYAIAVSGKGGYNYMHADGSNNIVCWESSNANSQWTMDVVNIDAETLNANWNELASIDPSAETTATYQTHLDNLFSDKACTTLKKSFANENAVKNDADYNALPVILQEMVLKVYKNSWAEENYNNNKEDWDAGYAKKYRVQLYEPYNEPEAAASALGINAHTNLNNPTGIFANDREALYVMVGGEIGAGASLYITSYTGNGNLGGYGNGVELKQGLNIVPSFGDGNNYCINYVVHTFDTSKGKGNKAKAYRLSDFEDLKIHIEGGYINGYYNKVGDDLYTPDQGADWNYLEARASQTTVTILGKYITLQFPLNDAVDNDGHTNKGMSYYLDQSNVEGIIDEWDNVMLWERLVLGLLDENTINAEAKKSPYSDKERLFDYTGNDGEFAAGYEDYYNVHGLSLGVGYNYMYGGWDHCGYHYNTMESILTNLPYNAGSHWGPGHEIGHQHQKLLTVNGLTEVTNNLFSNVVLWYYGETTSRVNGDEGSLSHVLAAFNTEGSDFFTNNIWAQTHMYYKLFLYYHVLGHNPKFYPRLFEMLRQDPMSGGYNQNGATSLLHFYKKCCLASGEDLTEFFRAYGFFSVMDNRLVGDYSNSVYTTTQADIDAAIKEVKDLGYDENIAVLFINDATGETIQSHKGDNLEVYGETTICAEVGGYASFTDNTTPDYTYSVSGTTVTMEGTGGTGFAIFNENGEIIAFSDKKTFTISEECAVALASGKAEVKAVKADNTPVEVVDVMDTDNTAAKYEALGELLDAAGTVIDHADATGTKVGYYRTDLLTDLQAAYETAKTVYDNETVASYNAVYDVLYQEYANVIADDFARIGIIEGNAYRLTNRAYTDRSMAVNTSNNQMSGVTTANTNEQKWYFEASNSLGRYYLKNKSTSLYPGDVSTGAVLSADKAADTKGNDKGAYAYEMRNMGNGLWALVGSTGLHCSASQSYNIVGWGADAEASQWYITAVEVDENAETLYELQTLITKTEALVDEMASVQYAGAVDMSTVTITSNATEEGHETKYLLDGKVDTYFHTVWKESTVSEPHYLQVDLGESKSLAEFVWTYTTYNTTWGADFPATVEVAGSADNQLWHDIATLSDLPRTKGEDFESVTLGSSNQSYRYLRFTVTATSSNGKFNNQYYFGLGEMGLTRMSTFVESIGDKYANFITAEELATVCDQVYAAQQTIASGSATSNDVAAVQAQYDILLQAHQNANNVEFNAKKEELLALISSTNSLINSCGTITYTPATLDGELALQTSNPNGNWYVSTNADNNHSYGGTTYKDGEGIAALVDDNTDTYFHTRWQGEPVGEAHYIQVDMGEGKTIQEFVFSYTPRSGSPAPTAMTIYGSNDASSFTQVLATITSDLPAHNSGKSYTSSTINSSGAAYRYLRFVVTGSAGPAANTQYGGQYFFGMMEFDITEKAKPESYTVTLGNDRGNVTEELLLTAYKAVQEAQSVVDYANTEAQVNEAIEKLQAQYQALEDAKKAVRYQDYAISALITESNVTVVGGGVVYKGQPYTTTLTAPNTLTPEDLDGAIEVEGYEAMHVVVSDAEIVVTYNKRYTVQVIGGKGNGGVTYNGHDYANGEKIYAPASFATSDLTAIVPTGYTLKDISIEDATVKVSFKANPLVDTEKYYTLECRSDVAHNTERFIRDNGSVINGRSSEGSLFQFEAADEDNGYFIKSYVSDKYLNCTANENTGNDAVVESELKSTVWKMAKHTEGVVTLTAGYDKYLNNNGDAPPYLLARYHNGGPASINACSLWTITEGTPLDMTDLKNLIDETNGLITSCYQNGNVDGELLYINSAHVTADLMTDIKTAVANAQAKYDAGRATTQGEYNTALTALQTANTTLASNISLAQTEASDRLTSREALRAKIEALRGVIAECGVIGWRQYQTERIAVPLTEANLSTNAQETSEGPIENLLTDDETFFHSSWKASAGAAHYIQVDLGEGKTLQEFVFGYRTRSKGPHPYVIVVSGSNDKDGSFEEIKVFNSGLPNTGSTSWEASAPIVTSQPYRYLRFTVTRSSDLRSYGEYCFAMSKFELKTIAYSENEDYYVEYLNPNGSVTEEQLLNAYRTMISAGELDNVNTTKSVLDAKIEELQTLCTTLETERANLQLPVELTTDIKNPVLYILKSRRGEAKALQYDPAANHMFSIADASEDDVMQMFYFTAGDTRTQVYVHPFAAGEQVLAAVDLSGGKEMVVAADVNSTNAMAMQWIFEQETLDDGTTWYSLDGVEAPYFSNWGGGSNKMGFHGSKDDGSRFKFVDVDESTIEGSSAYHSLKVYYDEVTKVKSAEIEGGSNPYYYPKQEADAYNEVYANTTSLLAGEASYEENLAAYKALKAANEALELNMPKEGVYYTIVSACNGDRGGQLMYALGDNTMKFSNAKTAQSPDALWTFTKEGYMMNLQTGCAINVACGWGDKSMLGESEQKTVSIESISHDGQVKLTPSGGLPLHAQATGSWIVGWTSGANDASAWRIVEVEDMYQVKHLVSITQYEHAGLYLNYPVTIPDEVKAYYLDRSKISIDDEGVGTLNLTEIEDEVIPARTAVILYAPHGNQTVGYDFVYAAAPNDEYDNLFTGSTYQTYREAEENHYYYVFGQNKGEIGLYKNGVKYKYNDGGAIEEVTEGATHYKMSANKILFDWSNNTTATMVKSFRFRLGTGGQTTSLEDALMMDNAIIYDLYGRRIPEVKISGLYIINGEKHYIHVK